MSSGDWKKSYQVLTKHNQSSGKYPSLQTLWSNNKETWEQRFLIPILLMRTTMKSDLHHLLSHLSEERDKESGAGAWQRIYAEEEGKSWGKARGKGIRERGKMGNEKKKMQKSEIGCQWPAGSWQMCSCKRMGEVRQWRASRIGVMTEDAGSCLGRKQTLEMEGALRKEEAYSSPRSRTLPVRVISHRYMSDLFLKISSSRCSWTFVDLPLRGSSYFSQS